MYVCVCVREREREREKEREGELGLLVDGRMAGWQPAFVALLAGYRQPASLSAEYLLMLRLLLYVSVSVSVSLSEFICGCGRYKCH